MIGRDLGLNPYVDYTTRTYKNLFSACSPEELSEREATYTGLRLIQLRMSPVSGEFDLDHLKEINRRIFQDVYPWAGQVRVDFDAAKQGYAGVRAYSFTPSAQIASGSVRIFGALSRAKFLTGLSSSEFVTQLAKLHGELNQLHAFPEGNGRTQRLFLEELAKQAGHPIDLSIGTQERIVEASIAQTKGDHAMMERFIREAADPDRVRALREALSHLQINWGKEKTSGTYIASTVAGQTYEGVIYSKSGPDFIFTTSNKIIIGHTSDLPETTAAGRVQFVATEGKKGS